MKQLLALFTIVLFTSCGSNISDQLIHIEGYWNIENVTLPDGSEREFPFSNHMDHFEIEGKQGIKYRVSPTYDGGFVNYGSPVNFTCEELEGELQLLFKDGEQSYTQTVVEATETELVLQHENGTIYTYSSYNPNDEE